MIAFYHAMLCKEQNKTLMIIGAGEKYKLEIGDHAISENIVPCWDCRYCKRGDYNMCEIHLHCLFVMLILLHTHTHTHAHTHKSIRNY